MEYSVNHGSNLSAFLKWWDESGVKKSISSPEEQDAIQVMTVHKAKGLEYGTVIMPYMGFDISSMKKAEIDVYVDAGKLAYGIKIGDTFEKKYNSNYDLEREQNERINEEARVFYVALTRAIRNFVWFNDCKSTKKITWQTLMEG